MRTCFVLSVLALALSGGVSSAQEEVAFTPTPIANFMFNGRSYTIHPMLANATRPAEQWQFRYELPPPARKRRRTGGSRRPSTSRSDEWAVVFRIALGLEEADKAAFESLKRAHPAMTSQLQTSNLGHLRPSAIRWKISFPRGLGGPQDSGEQPIYPGAKRDFRVIIRAADKKQAEAILEAAR